VGFAIMAAGALFYVIFNRKQNDAKLD